MMSPLHAHINAVLKRATQDVVLGGDDDDEADTHMNAVFIRHSHECSFHKCSFHKTLT